MTPDPRAVFVLWFEEKIYTLRDEEKAQLAAQAVAAAVLAERKVWCGDERGGFEQSEYTLPIPWRAAMENEGGAYPSDEEISGVSGLSPSRCGNSAGVPEPGEQLSTGPAQAVEPPNPTDKCAWCNRTYAEHDTEVLAAVPRMPCLGLKVGFCLRAAPTKVPRDWVHIATCIDDPHPADPRIREWCSRKPVFCKRHLEERETAARLDAARRILNSVLADVANSTGFMILEQRRELIAMLVYDEATIARIVAPDETPPQPEVVADLKRRGLVP